MHWSEAGFLEITTVESSTFNNNMSETNTRLYELGFILVPTTPETEVSQKVEVLKTSIKNVEGSVSSEGNPEYIDLAYPMDKTIGSKKSIYSQGYFGWLKFDADPSALEALKKSLDANEELVRYLLIKTDAANTITFKKPKVEAKRDTDIIDESELLEGEEMEEDSLDHEKLPDLADDEKVETEEAE
ncbi:MAG: 30S ribosomal protein S6 [Candidatus Pacebacteria bacterium]|nr:30S ribosomal protein S6 [Candidatus Paceibacterota bacterium]